MKISVNDEVIMEISESDISILKYNLKSSEFTEDIKRRIIWSIDEKIKNCTHRLLNDYNERLKIDNNMLPTSQQALVDIIFARADYKNRDARDLDSIPTQNVISQ